MGWSEWPSWLKGGIIISLISLISSFLPLICQNAFCVNLSTFFIAKLPIISSLFNLIFILPNYGKSLIIGMYTFVLFFIFGAILGKIWTIVFPKYKNIIYKGSIFGLVLGFILNLIVYFLSGFRYIIFLFLPVDPVRIWAANYLFPIVYISSGSTLVSDMAFFEIMGYVINSAIVYVMIGIILFFIYGKIKGK